jgi:hypothetical protein
VQRYSELESEKRERQEEYRQSAVAAFVESKDAAFTQRRSAQRRYAPAGPVEQ